MDEKQERLKQLRESLNAISQEEAQLARELGTEASTEMRDRLQHQDNDANLWDRMTPAERTELYQTDRDEWKRVLRAKEEAGTRRLLGWG